MFYSAHVVVYIGFLSSQISELFLVSFLVSNPEPLVFKYPSSTTTLPRLIRQISAKFNY